MAFHHIPRLHAYSACSQISNKGHWTNAKGYSKRQKHRNQRPY